MQKSRTTPSCNFNVITALRPNVVTQSQRGLIEYCCGTNEPQNLPADNCAL